MFDIGFAELFLLGVMGLIILGPERLPRLMRQIGLYVRKAKATWYSVKVDIEREMAAQDMRKALEEEKAELEQIGKDVRQAGRDVEQSVQDDGKS